MSPNDAQDQLAVALTRAARQCASIRDFSKVLDVFAQYCEADGCVIWEVITKGPDDRKFFALAESSSAGWTQHYLPANSFTAKAALNPKKTASS